MNQEIIRDATLHVLIVPADAGLDIAPFLPTLRTHYILLCPISDQVVEITRRFQPDIVLIDLRMPMAASFANDLVQASGGRGLVFVAMAPTASQLLALPSGFDYFLPLPATAGELEQLLWQISRRLATQPPSLVNCPGSDAIG